MTGVRAARQPGRVAVRRIACGGIIVAVNGDFIERRARPRRKRVDAGDKADLVAFKLLEASPLTPRTRQSMMRTRRPMMNVLLASKPSTRGFTLIELMIVVVIVGVLAMIAFPWYEQFVIRNNRSAAQRFMLDVANRQEQFLNNKRAYTAALDASGLSFPVPTDLATRYSFAIVVNNACCGPNPNWRITADSIGAQASDPDLTLDSRGDKTPADKW